MARLSEDQLIAMLAAAAGQRPDVILGIGDDGAVLAPPAGKHLVSVMDTLNEGVHFLTGAEPRAVGHRVVAVNLSDLAAMGAEPAWASISLSLPEADSVWVGGFIDGVRALASRWRMALVGGDTVRGPLSVCAHLIGFVDPDRRMTRDGARPGDLLFVTGAPGEARAGLELLRAGVSGSPLIDRFLWPEPRVDQGRALTGLATAAIDLSDGLAADLRRVADSSRVRIVVEVDDLPAAPEMIECLGHEGVLRAVIAGGDDYELAFTVPEEREDELIGLAAGWPCPVSRIGRIEVGEGLAFERSGRAFVPDLSGSWSHFDGETG